MKVCESCEDEIYTKDGENICAACEKKAIKKKEAAIRRRGRNDALRSLGLVRVRGALGGVYYE